VRADRYDPTALVNKGNVLMAGGDVAAARDLYREATMSDASCVEATYNLALAYKRLRRYDDALQCFGKLNVMLRNDAQVTAAPAIGVASTSVAGRFEKLDEIERQPYEIVQAIIFSSCDFYGRPM